MGFRVCHADGAAALPPAAGSPVVLPALPRLIVPNR